MLPIAARCLMRRLVTIFAQVLDQAGATARLAGDAGVASMQDQPVVGVDQEFLWHHAHQALFHREHGLARCDPGAVGHAEDMGVDGHRRLAKRGVEDHVGGLASDPGQRLESAARSAGTSPP